MHGTNMSWKIGESSRCMRSGKLDAQLAEMNLEESTMIDIG